MKFFFFKLSWENLKHFFTFFCQASPEIKFMNPLRKDDILNRPILGKNSFTSLKDIFEIAYYFTNHSTGGGGLSPCWGLNTP